MSLSPEIRDQAYQFFIEEVPELLQNIETGLLTIKEERSTAKVHELMRSAHSIKGGAASVDLMAIKTIAHRLEDIFKALYSDKVEIDTELESLLLQAFDCLRLPLTEQITNGEFDAEAAEATAMPVFAQIEELLGDSLLEADNFMPSSSDLGIDIVTSIFEVDVAQGIERLETVVVQPQNYEVAGEIRAQAEVFIGFAELLNLPGFGAIAQTALTALERHPEQAQQVAQLMLADCQAGRDAVMAGDRAQGGSPGEALVALTEAASAKLTEFDAQVESESFWEAPSSLADDFTELPDAALEDVFGSPTDLDATPDSVPALDEMFGEEAIQPEAAEPPTLDEMFAQEQLHDEHQETPETLEAALESVAQNFESLPSAEEVSVEPASAASESAPAPKQTAKPAQPTPQAAQLSVRVDLDRLERMNNLVGELAINRNSLSLQNNQLQLTVKELLNRFVRFQTMAGNLRSLSDQMLVAPERLGSNGHAHASSEAVAQTASSLSAAFDSLEMDSYGAMYSMLQGLVEESLQLEEAIDDVTLFARQSDRTIEQQRQMLQGLRDELMWARMLPLNEVLNRFPRVLRDLSTKYHKPVRLKLNGTGVLVDKAALEKLYDPLLHLLRNAFDHGIESPEVRRQQGKPDEAQIAIRAYYQGNQTVVEIQDNGQGINLDKVGQRAVEAGLLTSEQLAVTPKEQLYNIIFEPGFSTASQVSELSGRGVGLDVVRSQLRSLKGTIAVTSSPGQGSTFTLRLPLTLTVSKLLVCLVSSSAFALPSDGIEDIVVPQAEQIKHTGKQPFLRWQNQVIPIYRLVDLLDYGCPLPETMPSKALVTVPTPSDWAAPLLLMRRGQQAFALEVDRLVVEQELVIKPFGKTISAPGYTYGCTILGDGTLIPVIDGMTLVETVFETGTSSKIGSTPLLQTPSKRSETVQTQATTILVVDDSAALRRTLALTLQKAGYRVLQARDGREALDQLQQGSNVKLVICDIEMPTMNGFEFLSQRRRESQLTQIPVAMLTSRSNTKHRQLAMQLGANAYFTKPYIEQEFLEAVRNMLGQAAPEAPVLQS